MKASIFNSLRTLSAIRCRMPGMCALFLALICATAIPYESAAEDKSDKEERSRRLVKRGRELRKIGDLQGSLHDLNEAVRIDPYNTDAYVQRGITRSKKRDFDGSYFDFERALEIDPGDITALYGRGVMSQMKNDFEGAMRDFNEVIRLKPKHNLAIFRRGIINFGLEKTAVAIEDFTEIVESDPKAFAAFSARGVCKLNLGNFRGALTDFDRALYINPRLYRTLFARGKVHLLRGNTKAALFDFERALQINRQYPDVYLVRGLIHFTYGRDKKALEDLDKTLKLHKKYEFEDYPQLWSWFVRMRLGEEKEARQQLRKHYEKRLENEKAGGAEIPEWYSLQVRFQLGELNEETILNKAGDENDDPDIKNHLQCKLYYYAAQNKLLQNDPASAVPLLEKCVQTKRYGDIEYLAARLQLKFLGVKLEKLGQMDISPYLQTAEIGCVAKCKWNIPGRWI